MDLLSPGIARVAVRTPTLAPATHTNVWVLGEGEISVVDPASPYEDEQAALWAELEPRLDRGERVTRLVLTHDHNDHVAGALALRDALARRGPPPTIAAHPLTAEKLAGRIPVDEALAHGDEIGIAGHTYTVWHTPGHAVGHVVLQHSDTGAVIAGDLVAGVGTILIDPSDGDLHLYLDSLEVVRKLAPTELHPSHGPSLPHGEQVLAFYIAHRHQRTEQIRAALDRLGAVTAEDLVAPVYGDMPGEAHRVAASQIQSHLRWMKRHGLARAVKGTPRWEPTRA